MLVLASASARRAELLRNAEIRFRVRVAEIAETRRTGESPRHFAMRLASEKAVKIALLEPESLVLAADTIVVAGSRVLGKPRDAAEAKRMLRLLSGRSHEVITGVCLRGPDSDGQAFTDTRLESTEVRFEPLTDREIEEYVTSGEPLDKAGAYAIQGRASRWISGIRGDYANVVGLPVALVYRMLGEHGCLAAAQWRAASASSKRRLRSVPQR
ncbi:MAG: Maf family protein [Candidatus Korobacteraceae bacterium]|jgi:septum formation protein